MMNHEMMAALESVFEPTSLRNRPEAIEQFANLAQRICEENTKQNLTRILDPRSMAIRHFWESWSVLRDVSPLRGPVLDAGTGAGFPGLPMALIDSSTRFDLLDARKKKVEFLARTLVEMDLSSRVRAIHGRLEDHLRKNAYGDIVCRALAPVSRIIEWTAPHCRRFQRLILIKGPKFEQEWEEAASLSHSFDLVSRLEETLPDDLGTRVVAILESRNS